MERDDRPYYAERALAERYMSEAPLAEHSRHLHLELALRYEALSLGEEFDLAKLAVEKSRLKRRMSRRAGDITERTPDSKRIIGGADIPGTIDGVGASDER